MTVSLNRVILFVQNVGILKDFYQQHFSFEVTDEIRDEWVVLRAGNCELALHREGSEYVSIDPDLKGDSNNVKLVFGTDEDLRQLRERLVGNGVVMGDVRSFNGFPYLFCDGRDVEGNVFQLMQRV